jgi:2,3-diketo-5-methylthio-1-phosphopentane phosphatase
MSEARPKVYLLDVEGTVAPLTLTSDVLFPYARAHFESFLWQSIAENPKESSELQGSVGRDLLMLRLENEAEKDPDVPRILPNWVYDPANKVDPNAFSMSRAKGIPRFLKYIYWLMDRDRKSTALKSLQGKIWKTGFESSELKGTLFADVPEALRRWSVEGRVAIYSSGSVEAQKLFFRYSTAGDLTPLVSGYFDTRTGPKMESASYAAIAAAMDVAPRELLFFSDAVRELDAAREAGCGTRLVVREGNAPVDDAHRHLVVESFTSL